MHPGIGVWIWGGAGWVDLWVDLCVWVDLYASGSVGQRGWICAWICAWIVRGFFYAEFAR